MEHTDSTSKYPLIPPNEQKCVWMTAGILSYQLCDREFDCDHCPLDSAIRTFPDRTSIDHRPANIAAGGSKPLMPGYLYSRKHCWTKPTDTNTVRVGIEPLLASMLLNARTVVLPSTGDRVKADSVCAWIVLEGGTLPITSPIDGDILRTNAMLVDQPHDILDDPFERGWLFEVTTGEDIFNSSSLFRVAEASRHFNEDNKRFHTLVSTELRKHRSSTGVTLADGGAPVKDLAGMLGPETYFLLIRDAFL